MVKIRELINRNLETGKAFRVVSIEEARDLAGVYAPEVDVSVGRVPRAPIFQTPARSPGRI
jgi:hypothetical protein